MERVLTESHLSVSSWQGTPTNTILQGKVEGEDGEEGHQDSGRCRPKGMDRAEFEGDVDCVTWSQSFQIQEEVLAGLRNDNVDSFYTTNRADMFKVLQMRLYWCKPVLENHN